jgi:eukaryotic-like serine/threonine-protein kinase
VLSTDPGVGDRILKNGQVELTVSKGKERYKVPKLAGSDAVVARDTLARLNLVVGSEAQKYSEAVAAGKVMSSAPGPGVVVKRGQVVNLTISRGPQPIDVPNTTGQRLRDATRELRRLGFTVGTTEEFSGSVARGRVISQNPNSGERFANDKIQLVVSKGPPLVRVPSVWRMQTKDARTVLERAGFKVKVQRAALYVGLNVVAAQNPAGNSIARNGTTVTITVL